jgi:hypothetical protein
MTDSFREKLWRIPTTGAASFKERSGRHGGIVEVSTMILFISPKDLNSA